MESAASLGKLRLSELQKKARACGVPSDQVDDAADADDPRQELVRLILEALEASGAALRAELAELKLGALQKRARAAGGDSDRVDDAADAEDPRTELITMILELHQGPQPQAAAGGGGGEALTLVPQHLPSPSLASTPASSEGVPPTPLSSTSFSSPHATLTRHHSYGAEALREAGHVVLHQHHLEDTMGVHDTPNAFSCTHQLLARARTRLCASLRRCACACTLVLRCYLVSMSEPAYPARYLLPVFLTTRARCLQSSGVVRSSHL